VAHLIVGSCQIRTPFLETQDREWVVAYARRIYPGAKVFERLISCGFVVRSTLIEICRALAA
jgi:hypothetical protein